MAPKQPTDWARIVAQIREGDSAGEETLYQDLSGGARFFLQRRLGTRDVEDLVHDLFVVLVDSIRAGKVREPERFMGFVRTLLYRQISHHIDHVKRERNSVSLNFVSDLRGADPDPEQRIDTQRKIKLMGELISKMTPRDFDVLSRLYIREESPEEIQAALGLSGSQFYSVKSRAKARLTNLFKRALDR